MYLSYLPRGKASSSPFGLQYSFSSFLLSPPLSCVRSCFVLLTRLLRLWNCCPQRLSSLPPPLPPPPFSYLGRQSPHSTVTLCQWVSISSTMSSVPHPPPEKASPDEIRNILAKLKVLLTELPSQLPRGDNFNSKYGAFLAFALDEDILEKTGDDVATLGEQLEHAFGWRSRTTGDNIIPIVERGKAICALHPILVDFYTRFPDNNVLKKWIIDITLGAEKVYNTFCVPVCDLIS